MRHRIAILVGVLWLATTGNSLVAQPSRAERPERDPASRNDGRSAERQQVDSQPLTAEQKAQVKAILSKYDASSLTAKDARAINEAFRAAGLRNGPGLLEAIRAADFVPEKIGALDPPPGQAAGRLDFSVIRPPVAASPVAVKTSLELHSSEVVDGGQLPKDYTGDGTGATLPLEWSGAPEGTKSFTVIMHHLPPDGPAKWYWVLYNIPAETTSLPRNVAAVGRLGNNSINGRLEYAPPHSKGPGPKTYIYTVYALSSPVRLDIGPAEVSRDVLLAGMKDTILASAELHVVYSRDVEPARPQRATNP